ncbi:MAG: hypothetical protein ACKVZH_17320 [Blastocatellia bacterium]
MSDFKYQHGRLAYIKKSTGQERGREDWQLTRNRDGSITMRCLAMADDSKFVRDVTYTRSKDGRPMDAFIRLQVEQQLIGMGYFRVENDKLVVISDNAETGHTLQTLTVPAEHFSIVSHAVMLEGWAIFNYNRKQGGEQNRTAYNTSTQWNGTDGPLGRLETIRVNLLGEEEITVPAGTFKATHFTTAFADPNIPAAHLWVAGEDKVLLRYDWPEMDHEYVLTSWKTEKR